jgi:hypothetical protein
LGGIKLTSEQLNKIATSVEIHEKYLTPINEVSTRWYSKGFLIGLTLGLSIGLQITFTSAKDIIEKCLSKNFPTNHKPEVWNSIDANNN